MSLTFLLFYHASAKEQSLNARQSFLFGKKVLSYQSFIEVCGFHVDDSVLEKPMRPLALTLLLFPASFWSADQRHLVSLSNDDAGWFFLAVLLLIAYQLFNRMIASRREIQLLSKEREVMEGQLRESQALIHILTHDLAGPLFVIQSMAELQTEKTHFDFTKTHQTFEKVRNAAQSAQAMLKVVKELEAIEAGKIELLLKPVPLLASLQSTVESLKPLLDRKEVTVIVESDIPANVMVLGERTVLEHTIFHNVVANAIKFSQAGDRIEIRVNQAERDRVDVTIKDHGIGIPAALITQLFQHNSKTSRRGTSGEKGTGLGLPLARRYVQKFGGSIAVESQAREDYPDDHWTQFTVTLKKAG